MASGGFALEPPVLGFQKFLFLRLLYQVVRGSSIKYVRSWGGSPVRSRGEGGLSDADVRTFSAKNTSDFSKFMVCPHGQEGSSQCRHFSDKGEGVNFS